MAAEYIYYISSEVPDEPVDMVTSTVYTIIITNIGDEAGVDLGFYISIPSTMGEVIYPSATTPTENFSEVLYQGGEGYGLSLTQGLTVTTFETGIGDSGTTKIPLVLGSGATLDELAVGASITVDLTVTFKPGTPSETLYVDVVLE